MTFNTHLDDDVALVPTQEQHGPGQQQLLVVSVHQVPGVESRGLAIPFSPSSLVLRILKQNTDVGYLHHRLYSNGLPAATGYHAWSHQEPRTIPLPLCLLRPETAQRCGCLHH